MAKLTAAKRRSLPAKDFAGPGRSYPVDTPRRARAAAGFAAMHHASPAIKAKIKTLAKRVGEQHGPIDDMPKSHGRHHSQTGHLRVLGGKMC
jgi:hypothetical protein